MNGVLNSLSSFIKFSPFRYYGINFTENSFIVGANLKVPPLVHFTWFYTTKDDLKPEEMKFYQMVSLIAAYKKIKPHKIVCKSEMYFANNMCSLVCETDSFCRTMDKA